MENPDSTNAEGDVPDAKGLHGGSKGVQQSMGLLCISPDSEEYDMTHPKRGKCLIFNNKVFEAHTKLNERRGTEQDAKNLYNCFRELDFDVTIYHNFDCRKILSTLDEVAKEDHKKNDCFVCCILTHGDSGVLYGRDGKFNTDEVFSRFQSDVCVDLAGKPKLFFIQACQGDRLDRGTKLVIREAYDSAQVCKIPTQADFLIAYSTVPGYYSWRNTSEGSWFIQALCKVLEKFAKDTDLLQMMTIVARKVAYEFQSYVPDDPSMHLMKQVPYTTTTLTRKVYFPSKM